MTDIVERLEAIDHMNVEECFLDSHLYAEAAATIRALREALEPLANCEVAPWEDQLPDTDIARFPFSMGEIRKARMAIAHAGRLA